MGRFTADDNLVAQKFFQQAIDVDPTFTGGYSGLAEAQLYAVITFGTRSLLDVQKPVEALARQAVALDSADPESRLGLGITMLMSGDFGGAESEIEQALAISPNLAIAHGARGLTLIYSGRPKEGLAAIQDSIRLNPRDPTRVTLLQNVAVGLYFCREYEAANRTIRLVPHYPNPYRWLAAALGQLGRTDEAREALQKAIAAAPAVFEMYVRQRPPWFRPEDYAHMLEGLHKAGMPEQ